MEKHMQDAKTFKELLSAFKKCRDCYARNAVRLCQDEDITSQMQTSLDASQKTPGFIEIADHLMLMGFDDEYGPYSEPDGSQTDIYNDYLSSLCKDAAKKLQAVKIFIEVWVLHTKVPNVPDYVCGDPLSPSYVSQE